MEGVSGCFALIVLLLILGGLWWYLWRRRAKDLNDDTGDRTPPERLQPRGDEPRDDPNARRDN